MDIKVYSLTTDEGGFGVSRTLFRFGLGCFFFFGGGGGSGSWTFTDAPWHAFFPGGVGGFGFFWGQGGGGSGSGSGSGSGFTGLGSRVPGSS